MKHLLLISFCLLAFMGYSQDTASLKTFLAVLTLPKKYQQTKHWDATAQETVGRHFRRLVELEKKGTVVLAGRTDLPINDKNMMGLIILKAKTLEDANLLIRDDPAVKAGIMHMKIMPYNIAVGKYR